MKFKKVTIDDLDILKNALTRYGGRICDISPANLGFWRDYYDISYYVGEDGFAIRFGDMDNIVSYYCSQSKALAEKIIAARPSCKIVFCTGYEEYAIPAFKLHASGYLMKPITAEAVQKEIDYIKGIRTAEKLLKKPCSTL